jgi:hypothetical protein
LVPISDSDLPAPPPLTICILIVVSQINSWFGSKGNKKWLPCPAPAQWGGSEVRWWRWRCRRCPCRGGAGGGGLALRRETVRSQSRSPDSGNSRPELYFHQRFGA